MKKLKIEIFVCDYNFAIFVDVIDIVLADIFITANVVIVEFVFVIITMKDVEKSSKNHTLFK